MVVCFAIVAGCNCNLMFEVSAYSLFDLLCRYACVFFYRFQLPRANSSNSLFRVIKGD